MTEAQKWRWVVILLVFFSLLYLLAPILTPFFIAALLAYLGDPLTDRLERQGLPRTLAVSVVFISFTSLAVIAVALLLPLLERQVQILIGKLPHYIEALRQLLAPLLEEYLGQTGESWDWGAVQQSLKSHWQGAGSSVSKVLASISRSGLALVGILANVILIPVVTFYLLRDWDHLILRIHDLLPRAIEPVISRLARESDEVLGAFLRGQLLVMSALGSIYAVGLWLVGLDLAILIGFIAGLVSFVPYLGFILGLLMAGIAALMQFQDAFYLLPVLLVFGVGQALEGMVLTPQLVGNRIGLHPVAVIFAVMAGAQLFGFIGVLIALPVAAVIMVLLRFLRERYIASELYRD